MKRYAPKEIEKKWQERWEKDKTFKVDVKSAKKPYYNLMMFPYPSGEGLHVGHVYAFGGADTFGRYQKMKGSDVFEPMGFDSFGIHSENYAIKVKQHPKDLIEETTSYFRENQLKKLGGLFDWDHQVITSEADYYKWTQWIFIQLFKAGLAVRKKAPVDWCSSCRTVLADEQVITGHCERCKTQVIQKELEQWFFKITNYAQKLLDNLDHLPDRQAGIDWSETTKTMQRNWIGRSEGAEIDFEVKGTSEKIRAFTTRPDTIYGATFMVLAPEHELASKLAAAKQSKAIDKYIAESKKVSEEERYQAKTGIFTGSYCINPFTKKEIPIWIADYVLMGYGTGAIMAVPAHDMRDYDFAKEHSLDIVEVISGGNVEKEAFVGEGKMVNSGEFDGLSSKEGIKKISDYMESNKLGRKTVNYHLRDWLISRQRYWGPPIPMIFCESCAKEDKTWFTTEESRGNELIKTRLRIKLKSDQNLILGEMKGWYPVPEKDLPVELPELKDYQPKGKDVSPLATLPGFVDVKCPECGSLARRETDVSDTFLDSSWYFLRYPTVGAKNESEVAFDKDITKKWLPVDSYIGGNEHAVLHLLYTRFITMALEDCGLIDFEEPFKKFRAHGLVIHDGVKMSKSRGNVVNPNEFIDSYGADTLRMYLLFIGPYDQGGEFSDRAIAGLYRFLNRVWGIVGEVAAKKTKPKADSKLEKELNKLIKTVGEDLESLKFNTAIASQMEFLNLMYERKETVNVPILKQFVLLLSPFAPHIAEELWSVLGGPYSVHQQSWPSFDSKRLEEEVVTVVIQVNGHYRDKLEASKGISKEEATRLALDRQKIKSYTKDRRIERSIWIEGRLLNLVTGK
jgi:leucyl-tRNA synthetase